KFAPKSENEELFKSWINLIYGPEDQDSNDSSISSDNEADIPSAGNQRQWQYAYKLSLLESQLTNSNNNEEIEKNLVNINEDPQDSLSTELWESFSISNQATTEDEFTRYMKEQIAHKNQNPLT
ncbi:923_t:CDS:2, partial [Cetraspora pellucida]